MSHRHLNGVKVYNFSKLATGGPSRKDATSIHDAAIRMERTEVALPDRFDPSYSLEDEMDEMEIERPLDEDGVHFDSRPYTPTPTPSPTETKAEEEDRPDYWAI